MQLKQLMPGRIFILNITDRPANTNNNGSNDVKKIFSDTKK